MAKVKVRLLKPLNGAEIGSEAEYNQQDVGRLVSLGAVEVIKKKAARTPRNKMENPPKNKGGNSGENPPNGGDDKPAEG